MREILDNFSRFLDLSRGVEGDARTREQEEYARMARLRAMRIERVHLDQAASGQLGDATLGTLRDAHAANLLDRRGLFLGALAGRLLHLNADGHHLVFARAGGGKGTTSVQPNLAHDPGSLFVTDMKDGELHFSSADHRAALPGHEVILLDPWGIRGGRSHRANPLHRLGTIARTGRIDDEADDVALILLPKGKADTGDEGWARKGARRMLALRMKHLAYAEPDKLRLSELWRFVNCSDADLEAAFDVMIASAHEDVSGPAAALKAVFQEAPKQFEAYRSDCADALGAFAPGGALARATDGNDVDFGQMKHRPTTVYLSVASGKLGVAAPWIALMINHAIEQIAAETGPLNVRFLVDEFAQLPAPIPAVMKALRLYRGRGILLSLYCQGRFSLQDAGYAESAIKEIEDQAACIQMWGVEDPSLLRDIEYWSGNSSVVQVMPSHNGAEVANAGLNRLEQKRALLQVEDIRRINEGRQIVKLPGFPLFVIDRVPYWRVHPWRSQLRDVRELHFAAKQARMIGYQRRLPPPSPDNR